jgi:hypothetical protein
MASNGVRPTSPPSGPALVRPAVGALLLSLSGMACGGDDGVSSEDTANDSQPPMIASEGPMPYPTTGETVTSTDPPPMPAPTTAESESADTGSSTAGNEGNTEEPPMPPTTGDGSGSSSGSGSDSGSTGPLPPMPDPLHEDDQED